MRNDEAITIEFHEASTILMRGVSFWNQWRQGGNFKPDLHGSNLSGKDLEGADLSNTNLSSAILSGANLNNANLKGATLAQAKLNGANLRFANLENADLFECNLENADLYRANLKVKYIEKAAFSGAKLKHADLSSNDLRDINLRGVDLREVNLSRVNLKSANLAGIDLTGADLSFAQLNRAILLDSILLNVTLTGACIENWNISRYTVLDRIKCAYIYFVEGRQERRPRDPSATFKAGEFEALVKKLQDTIDLIFVDDVDWRAFFQSFQELREKYQDEEITIQAIERKGDAFLVRLETSGDFKVKGEIEASAKELYERNIKLLESQVADYEKLIESEKAEKSTLLGIVKTMSESQGPKYDLRGAKFGGGFASESGHAEGGNLNDFSVEQKQSIAQVAQEIQDLLQQLASKYPTSTPTQRVEVAKLAVQEIEKDPTFWQRVIGAGKAAGMEALKEAVDNPIFNIMSATLDGFIEP
jgi:uncharacterized protein YjbI with pentapeptide repeats